MHSDEDWQALISFLPAGWEELAVSSGALKRARGFADPERLLRVLFIHLAQGCSLRETAVRARRSGVADVSDVAILKRLRRCEGWLLALCRDLCRSTAPLCAGLQNLRRRLVAVDATCISEPGSTGTDWKLHYALQLPSLDCLHFELTDAAGAERLGRFPFAPGDVVLGDRAYCTLPGIAGVLERGADVLVRMKLSQTNFHRPGRAEEFDFLQAGQSLGENQSAQWAVVLGDAAGVGVSGRLCLLRRSEEVARLDRERIQREARKKQRNVRERTLLAADFVGLFTTLPAGEFPAELCFEIYRFRWQIELAFKRLKTLTSFGHLPKQDPASCRAWIYGKLLVGLLAERMAQAAFFP